MVNAMPDLMNAAAGMQQNMQENVYAQAETKADPYDSEMSEMSESEEDEPPVKIQCKCRMIRWKF